MIEQMHKLNDGWAQILSTRCVTAVLKAYLSPQADPELLDLMSMPQTDPTRLDFVQGHS